MVNNLKLPVCNKKINTFVLYKNRRYITKHILILNI